MTLGEVVQGGRAAFAAEAWKDACELFLSADRDAPLELEDLERLAVARYLVGDDGASTEAWGRAFRAARERGDAARAVRCAFWAAFVLLNRGDLPAGAGWVARGQRLLDRADGPDEVVEQGYVGYLVALRSVLEGDVQAAQTGFEQAARIGAHYGDADLETLARLGLGRVLIRLGHLMDFPPRAGHAACAASGEPSVSPGGWGRICSYSTGGR